MWIEKIELTNFKAYQNQCFTFPKPEQGRNLVLIGGMNGFGKTTLLEALYLCLYGEDATHHLARAGLQSNSYAKFLQGALHGKNLSSKRDQMRVTSRLMVADDFGFEITRTWFFDRNGELQDQEVRLEEIRNDIQKPLDRDSLAIVLEEHVVPANLAPFFFFDGEEVKKLADQDRTGWIKQGMESLMGVVLVKKLRERLVQYQNNRRANTHNVDKSKLDEMLNSLNSKIEEQEQLQNNILISNEEIARNQARRDEVQRKLLDLGVGNGNVKGVEDILREEVEKKQFLSNCEKQLENVLADRLPFHLVSSNLMESLKTQLSEEKIRIGWDTQKQELEPRKNKFADAFFNTEFLQKQNESIKGKLAECIALAWETLFFPRPENCANELAHDYLESRQRQRLEDSFSNIQVGANQIRNLVTQRKEVELRLDELKMRRIKLESIDNDGLLKNLNDELAEVQNALETQNRELGNLDRQSTALESSLNQERAAYERVNENYIRSEPAKSIANKAQKVMRLIDDLLPRLFELKTVALSQAVTRYYKQLAHKQQISNIIIQADGSCRLFGEDGKEIKFDRSAGENQLFATALFAGLAEVSGYEIPLVVDTPLARLDSQHRKNLLSYWYSKPDRQVILLSQDEEVDEALMQSVSPYLSKTYLLESTLIGEGIYKTVAKENAYFGDEYEWN
jgi:DNA sulfur modification protein DndD